MTQTTKKTPTPHTKEKNKNAREAKRKKNTNEESLLDDALAYEQNVTTVDRMAPDVSPAMHIEVPATPKQTQETPTRHALDPVVQRLYGRRKRLWPTQEAQFERIADDPNPKESATELVTRAIEALSQENINTRIPHEDQAYSAETEERLNRWCIAQLEVILDHTRSIEKAQESLMHLRHWILDRAIRINRNEEYEVLSLDLIHVYLRLEWALFSMQSQDALPRRLAQWQALYRASPSFRFDFQTLMRLDDKQSRWIDRQAVLRKLVQKDLADELIAERHAKSRISRRKRFLAWCGVASLVSLISTIGVISLYQTYWAPDTTPKLYIDRTLLKNAPIQQSPQYALALEQAQVRLSRLYDEPIYHKTDLTEKEVRFGRDITLRLINRALAQPH